MLSSFPKELIIHLSDRCNITCEYCYVDKRAIQNTPDITIKKALSIFSKFPQTDRTISFLGGEPFLRLKKIKKAYEYSCFSKQQKKVNVSIVTNGTLITKEAINFLKRAKPELGISIDGNKTSHDTSRILQKTSCYETVLRNLRLLKKNHIFPKANIVFTPKNYYDLLSNIRHVHDLGISHIDFNPDLTAIWNKKQLISLKKIFIDFSHYYISLFTKNNTGIFTNGLLYSLLNNKRRYNSLRCDKLLLYCNGDLYICDKTLSLPLEDRFAYVAGNVKNGLNNKLRLSLLNDIRGKIEYANNGKCNSCRFHKHCFCQIGSYILLTSRGVEYKEYFPIFCELSLNYLKTFQKIILTLKNNTLFKKTYAQ